VMAEYRARATGEQRGGLGAERKIRGVGQPVHAAMDQFQSAAANPSSDRGATDTGGQQLRARDASLLRVSNCGDPDLDPRPGSEPYSPTTD
jgi:hypothetical protein